MKVILQSDVSKLGRKGEVVTVADGYGRNYLIPQGKATYATEGAVADIELKHAQRLERERKQIEALRGQLESLTKNGVTVSAPANEQGHLFAAVHADDIASSLSAEIGEEVPSSAVALNQNIKETGAFTVPLVVGEETTIEIPIQVVAQEGKKA